MGVYIPSVEMPRGCNSCPLVMEIDNTCSLTMGGCTKDKRPPHCPLIEIDHTNTELLEFFNEFKKWKASKEVAKYINAVYGERRE